MTKRKYVASALVALLCMVPGPRDTYAVQETGIMISPTTGLVTTEGGGSASFSVVLGTQPTANVTFTLASSDTTEGTVAPSTLTFTKDNWNTSQPVLVSGVTDAVDDGDIPYTIVTAAATSSDLNYSGYDPSDVSVTNMDDDTAGFDITPTSGLTTTEAGGTATFKVKLTSQPTADVTLPLSSSTPAEGTVSPVSLKFTPSNWMNLQTVTAKGVNDSVADGNIAYSIITAPATSSDTTYNGLNASDVSVTNNDDDTAGVIVTQLPNLTSTETGGTTSFKVKLATLPTSNVTIALASNDTSEGTITTPSTLTFTSANGRNDQTVTIKGVNDTLVDGDVGYKIITGDTASSDPKYDDIVVDDVDISNRDDEAVKFSTSTMTVNESAGTANVEVQVTGTVLENRPVSVKYATVDGSAQGNVDFASATGTLIFEEGQPTRQTITIPLNNDTTGEPNETFTVALSAPTNTILASPTTMTVNIPANDAVSFSVSTVSVQETVGNATFTVKLNGPNTTQNVNVGYATSDGTATEGTDYTATSGVLTFTPNQTSKTFTVPILNDAAMEADEAFSVVLTASDTASLATPSTEVVTILANDTALSGVTVTAAAGLKTTEAGGSVTFKVALKSQPASDVTIALVSDDTTEGTVNPASVKFTTTNWATAQTVSVKGVNDFLDDGDMAYTIVDHSDQRRSALQQYRSRRCECYQRR